MKIKKRSGEFRGRNWCTKAREYDELHLESRKNPYYDNAIIAKDIIKGYLNNEFEISEFHDLVNQGVEKDYLTERAGEARQNQLVKSLERYCKSEMRTATFLPKKELEIGDYLISIKPDAVFYDNNNIELVIYRVGKPDITMNGKKRDASVEKCLELYFLLQYGRSLIPKGKYQNVTASYYFLRKNTDSHQKPWDDDFFSEKGGNIVFLEQPYIGGDNTSTPLDTHYLALLEEYSIGKECTDEDCKKCMWNTACNYVKIPELFDRKTNSSKKGKIIPSDTQQAIINFRKGVCRVNAAAGSGKTECMTERGSRMFEEGVKPSEILFITFTNSGAVEMKERICKKCQERGLAIHEDEIQAMTFNTFAYRIVKANYKDCGFTKEPTVVDDVRNSVIVTQLLDENPVDGLDYLNFTMSMPNCRGALDCSKKVFEIIKSENIQPDDPDVLDMIIEEIQEKGYGRFIGSSSIQELMKLYETYDKQLKEDNLLQFADQEPLMHKILEMHPGYLEQFEIKHIIVDEFQDSSDMQLETIRKLTECSCFESLMVVGDDAQSIYGFRNTSTENILHFFDKIGMEGEDLFLVENRRSTPQILDLANKINQLNENRVEKDMIPVRESGKKVIVRGYHSKEEEYKEIAYQIKTLIEQGYQPEDIAFIAYKKSELVAMGAELSRADIPWVLKNPLPLMENPRVKAALSLAEAFYQPDAEQLYFDYLTAKYDGEIFQHCSLVEIKNEVTAMKEQFMDMELLDIPYQRILFHDLLNDLRKDGVKDEIYDSFLELLYQNEDFQSELEYIRNFNIFGERVSKKMEETYQGVVLTTAHSSKGLEWKCVFNSITNYDSKTLHGNSEKIKLKAEEARRLLFVSITRARDLLWISGQYVAYGSKEDRTYNQFLKEVFDALDEEYNPIDPNEELKKLERKKKASARKAKRHMDSATSNEMTEEDKAEYARLTQNAKQVDIFDLLN